MSDKELSMPATKKPAAKADAGLIEISLKSPAVSFEMKALAEALWPLLKQVIAAAKGDET